MVGVKVVVTGVSLKAQFETLASVTMPVGIVVPVVDPIISVFPIVFPP